MATAAATNSDRSQASVIPAIDVSTFRTHGFTVVENVIAQSRIDRMREKVLHHSTFGVRSAGGIAIADFLAMPEFSFMHDLPNDARVRAVLGRIFAGERYRYCSHNDIGIDRLAGWHKDKLNNEYARYQRSPIFPEPNAPAGSRWTPNHAGNGHFIVKAALYLSDHVDNNHSLMLVPGTHTKADYSTSGARFLHPKKGSLVVFEQRITHRGQLERGEQAGRVMVSLGFGRVNHWTDEFEAGTRARQRNQRRCQDAMRTKQMQLEASGRQVATHEWYKQAICNGTLCGGPRSSLCKFAG